VLNPPHAGHASHATCACTLSRSLEWTCKAAALLRSFFSSSPFVISSPLQWSSSLHAQPKAKRSNAAPMGEGVLSDRAAHAGHTSHATCACALSRSLEWTCKAAAIAAHAFRSSLFVLSSLATSIARTVLYVDLRRFHIAIIIILRNAPPNEQENIC
jgi:hypothetical protein